MRNIKKLLFCPVELFRNLTNRRTTLILGIIFVGIVDIITLLVFNFNIIFIENIHQGLFLSVFLTIIIIAFYGIIDVCIFTIPLFDLFKHFKTGEEGHVNEPSYIKLAKIYIIPHLIITPFNLAMIFTIRNLSESEMTAPLLNSVFIIQLLLNIWFCGIITRGINNIYNFRPLTKRFVFIIVYSWTLVFAYISESIISDFVLTVLT